MDALSRPEKGSGCGVEGHGVAEVLQFADVLADLAFGIGAGGVVVGAEVDELRLIVGEQRPDDHEDGAADRHDGPVLAAPSGDAAVALAEEGVGAGGTDRGLAEHSGEVAVAVPGAGVALLPAGGLAHSGAKRAREARCGGVGKRVMSVPISARINCAAIGPTPGIASSRSTTGASSPS